MVEPITMIAGAAVISGIAQAYQRSKAQGAARDELNKIKNLYDELVPPNFNQPIESPPEMIAEKAKISDFDWEKLTPEKFEQVGQYAPEIAPYVKEVNPSLVQDTVAGKLGMQSQLSALRQLQNIGEGGIDPLFAQQMQEASNRSQREAQSRQESILLYYQRRGLMGSGTQLAAELSASEGAMQRGASQTQDAAAQAYLNQLQSVRDSASLGGQIREQELDTASRNAQIANAFNQRTSAAYQNYLADAANQRNQAAIQNLRSQQGIADANVSQANRSAEVERDRQDKLLETVRQQSIGNIAAENAAKINNYRNRLGQGELKRGLEQANFDNKRAIIAGKSGIGGQIAQNRIGQGQINADVISGIGQGVQQGILTNEQMNQNDLQNRRQRAYDKKMGVEY